MKTFVLLLFSMATSLTGVFIRSCQSVPSELLDAWCGAPPQTALLAQHQHCAGCALAVTGLILAALSLVAALRRPGLIRATSR